MKTDPFLVRAVFDQLTLRDVIKAANPDEIHVHVGGFLLRFLEWEIHEGRGKYDNVEFFWPGESHGPSEQDTVCSLHPGVPFRVCDRLKLIS